MARQSAAEQAEDLHAELGYRHAGRREVRVREWFSLRGDPGEAAPTPKAFKRLVLQLRNARHNPARHAALKLVRTERRHGQVFACAVCAVEWCAIGTYRNGTVPRVCSPSCWAVRRKANKQRSLARRRRGERAERSQRAPDIARRRALERELYAQRAGAVRRATVYRCAECAAEWCPVDRLRNQRRRVFCTPACRWRSKNAPRP